MRKRRKTTARRKRNPSRVTTRASARRVTTKARKSTRRRHHRNPTSGLVSEGLKLGAGSAATQFALSFIPPIGGMSPVADAARTAAAAFLLGKAAEQFSFTRRFAQPVQLGGFALAAGKLVNAFVVPYVAQWLRPAPAAAANGMKGIGVWPGVPQQRGMNGIGVWPGIPPQIPPMPVAAKQQNGRAGQ